MFDTQEIRFVRNAEYIRPDGSKSSDITDQNNPFGYVTPHGSHGSVAWIWFINGTAFI